MTERWWCLFSHSLILYAGYEQAYDPFHLDSSRQFDKKVLRYIRVSGYAGMISPFFHCKSVEIYSRDADGNDLTLLRRFDAPNNHHYSVNPGVTSAEVFLSLCEGEQICKKCAQKMIMAIPLRRHTTRVGAIAQNFGALDG